MGKYRKKPVIVEAVTFDEFVRYGIENGGNVVNGMPWSFEYKGHPVTHHHDSCYLIPTLEGTMQFTTQDLLITGVNGEIYPCKKDIFDKTYEEVKEVDSVNYSNWGEPQRLSMNFGQALQAVKVGKRIGRKGWNGKGMYVYYVPGGDYPTQTESAKREFGETAHYNPYLAIKTVQGSVSTWVPSINDCLAEDWEVVE